MAFSLRALTQWVGGTVLVGQPDDIPETALRVSRNARNDKFLGSISSRVGITKKTSGSLGGVVLWIAKLFGAGGTDYSYGHIGGAVYRHTDAWGTQTSIGSAGATSLVSSATMPSGAATPVNHLYLTCATGPITKDSGTTASTWGIAPPTAAPTSLALASDLTTLISDCSSAAAWTGDTLFTGPTDDTYALTGGNSVAFNIVAGDLGSVSLYPLPSANLDTLSGGDSTVKNDDYIHVAIALYAPEFLEYMQIDVDVDADTTGVADAFRDNFYSAVVPGSRFLPGQNQWTHIQVRKSEFQRYGLASTRTWANAVAFRLRFKVSDLGDETIYMDDIKLRGGVDLEGDVAYTVAYRNNTTKGLGNPPKQSSGATLWTSNLTTDRQRITVTLSNVAQGGGDHPGDTQIDKMWLYRRTVNYPDGIRVAEMDDTTTSYTDNNSEAVLALSPLTLEVDNDVPPTGGTFVWGPGATNRLWLIANGFRVRFSKAWERNYNRAENWPLDNEAQVGDGGQRAVCGLITDTQNIVWTEAATYQIVGVGAENYLPVIIPNSRGIVGPRAMTSGDGRLFFASQDGVYEQVGLTQRKITSAIDPFFLGQTIDSNPTLATGASALATMCLQWSPDPKGPFVQVLYAASGSSSPTKRLIIKKNPQTGQYTDCFFDDSTPLMQCLCLDVEDLDLLAGADDGHVYKLEDHGATSDDGTGIPFAVQTRSHNDDAPRQKKRYASAVVEGSTGGATLTAVVWYDKNTAQEALGTFSSSSIATQSLLTFASATAEHQDVAVSLTGTAPTGGIVLSLVGWHSAAVGAAYTYWDSDNLTIQPTQRLDRIELDLLSTASITLRIYEEETLQITATLAATVGRTKQVYVLTSQVRGHTWRITLSSTTSAAFELYSTDLREILHFVTPAVFGTFWDSDDLPLPTSGHLERLEFDARFLASVSLTIYGDGSSIETATLSSTSGRQRVTYVLTTALRARLYRVTLSSASAFELYSTDIARLTPATAHALLGTRWDSDYLTFPFPVYLKWVDVDLVSSVTVTMQVYMDAVLLTTQAIAAPTGRQRLRVNLPATTRGKSVRVVLSGTVEFELFGLLIWQKPVGVPVGYRAQPLYRSAA